MAYGMKDASLQAAGGAAGVSQLVDAFYTYMDELPGAAKIRNMHPSELDLTREKLKVFLVGWLGGPKNYAEKFGRIHIPKAHAHLTIDEAERDAWLLCMSQAVADQSDWQKDFKEYFMSAIAVPAERCRQASVGQRGV